MLKKDRPIETARYIKNHVVECKQNGKDGQWSKKILTRAQRIIRRLHRHYNIERTQRLFNMKEIKITAGSQRLTPEEIQAMIDEADRMAAEDAEVRGRIEAKNRLEATVYNQKNEMNNSPPEHLLPEQIEIINNFLEETISWLDLHGDSASKIEIDEKSESLSQFLSSFTATNEPPADHKTEL